MSHSTLLLLSDLLFVVDTECLLSLSISSLSSAAAGVLVSENQCKVYHLKPLQGAKSFRVSLSALLAFSVL